MQRALVVDAVTGLVSNIVGYPDDQTVPDHDDAGCLYCKVAEDSTVGVGDTFDLADWRLKKKVKQALQFLRESDDPLLFLIDVVSTRLFQEINVVRQADGPLPPLDLNKAKLEVAKAVIERRTAPPPVE